MGLCGALQMDFCVSARKNTELLAARCLQSSPSAQLPPDIWDPKTAPSLFAASLIVPSLSSSPCLPPPLIPPLVLLSLTPHSCCSFTRAPPPLTVQLYPASAQTTTISRPSPDGRHQRPPLPLPPFFFILCYFYISLVPTDSYETFLPTTTMYKIVTQHVHDIDPHANRCMHSKH